MAAVQGCTSITEVAHEPAYSGLSRQVVLVNTVKPAI